MTDTTESTATAGVDPQTYRDVLSRYVTGVTVVTALDERDGRQQPWGTTVNSFTSVSLEPPLVLVAIGHERSIHPLIERTRRFAVNVLGEDSQALSDCFAGAPSDLPREAFCNAEYRIGGECQLPVLEDALAYVGCAVERVIPAGDHTLYIGRVLEAGTSDGPGWPLLYYRRRYLRIEHAEAADLRGKPQY
ncbi:MAG TPA: flavin reductase family protein [Candidatus Limnocylindrales bacterium]|jgi:flavin reductase (DIM6/NTAB) family NADH-FMN oxidoreductase RutF|nr:flavin reductase family protein [Candidatus Limnocylindrales bacterium]